MARMLWGMADAGVCISQSVQRYAVRVEGARPDKLHVIYYGLPDTPRYDRDAVRAELTAQVAGLPADGLWLGLFSRLVEPKGIPYALQAMAQLRAEHPSAHLLIAGDGPLKDALTAQAQTLGITDQVHFLGWRTDAHRLMAALDLFLMPSLWEGFGISLLEAMSQALPIIGSTAGAIPEVIVDGQTGLTVPPADAPALASAIRRLLVDAPLRRALGEAGLARLHQQFGVDRMVDEHRALYAQLAKIP
jgi:glycosyltransferase involved in cell wall biosynthesis